MDVSAQLSVPFQTLSRSFAFSNDDEAKWWQSTAPMFAQMMAAAKYNVHAQYRFLCMHHEFVIPNLGPYPRKGHPMHWKSHLTRFGLPFELSFNYSNSQLRFAFEPIGPLTGSELDPYNTKQIHPVLRALTAVVPELDLCWFNHFVSELVVTDEEVEIIRNNNWEIPCFKTQNKLAADLDHSGGIVFKMYIYPRIKSIASGTPKDQLMFSAIRKADPGGRLNAPLAALQEFMASRSATLIPHFLSCDLVQPSKSRIKVYCYETQLELDSIADIWTLGGRRAGQGTRAGLELLKELWQLLPITQGRCALPDCFYELGESPQEQLPFIINFTLSPNSLLPEPQIYFPSFGQNDKATADGLEAFFGRVGYEGMATTYTSDLASYYPDLHLANTNHVQAWLSFSFRQNHPYMSTYLHTFEAMGCALGRHSVRFKEQ
ncbi:putative tryptophan dimethylallyltransferase [Aspergillus uvarum CBS 121591]|uniref:Putative tryptophan dimethylallyltransferase n=1 Tax=Aspergillus uvarum CBS 121591 TaxID=1448315 RepID=A0A319BSN6_9EURO|nr:putative tryptophan dimethylallyltransferase [Aspergillus uvarum CBS 121591]PYH76606.1 putative tryptophan dimethylallyltransferase [Aspergillus uvarum CBS 121591]